MVIQVPIILAFGRLKQENGKFEASLDYIVRPCLRNKQKQKAPTITKNNNKTHVVVVLSQGK
jgi:hypothetical protein